MTDKNQSLQEGIIQTAFAKARSDLYGCARVVLDQLEADIIAEIADKVYHNARGTCYDQGYDDAIKIVRKILIGQGTPQKEERQE